MIKNSNNLPLVGRSKFAQQISGGGTVRGSGPHPKNPSDFSTSPQGGGLIQLRILT
jgi:hypothetical protein